MVLAQDRPGLLRDISEVYAREKLNVVGVNSTSSNGEARMLFTIEIRRRIGCQPCADSGAGSERRVFGATSLAARETAHPIYTSQPRRVAQLVRAPP